MNIKQKAKKARDFARLWCFCFAICVAIGVGVAHADGFDDVDQSLDQQLLEDGRLDITVAYGFQQKQPSDALVPGVHEIAKLVDSFDLDQDAIHKSVGDFDKELMSKGLGFKRTPGYGETIYETTIKRGDRVIPVRINVLYPTGRDSVDKLKGQFLAALKSSDVIIYDGHSRNGGGFPDFDRPAFGHGKIFEENFDGSWSGVGQHPFNRNKKQVLAVISCESDKYYRRMLRDKIEEKNPDTLALILTQKPTLEEDLAPTNVALITGLMKGDQPENIMKSMELAARNYFMEAMDEAGKSFDPKKLPPLFSEDGFVTRWITAPGWHTPAVDAESRAPKFVPPGPPPVPPVTSSVPAAVPAG